MSRKSSKVFTILFISLICFGYLGLLANFEIEPVSAYAFDGGNGNVDAPYEINSIEDLDAIRLNFTAFYELKISLDFDSDSSYDDPVNGLINKTSMTTGTGWLPIGNNPYETDGSFKGQFNGGGFTISNLFIARSSGINHIGLFGWLGEESATPNIRIFNIGLLDVDITWSGANTYACTGALVGASQSPNGAGNGQVTIYNSYSTGSVTGKNQTGGLIGRFKQGTIYNCWSNATVTGEAMVGGFIGKYSLDTGYGTTGANSYLDDSFARGSVTGDDYIGGFIGYIGDDGASYTLVIDDCYSTGAVTGSFAEGGFIGKRQDDGDVTVTNCFWDQTTSGTGSSDGGTAKSTAQMQDYDTFNDATWAITDPADMGLFDSGDGSSGDPYEITSIEELNAVRPEKWYIDDGNAYPYLLGDVLHFELLNDLDFDSDDDYETPGNKGDYTTGDGWLPIGNYVISPFSGTFDGGGFTISNLYFYNHSSIYADSYPGIGLFGTTENATIHSLHLVDINITVLETAEYYIGGLIGYLTSYYGSTHVYNCSATGIIDGSSYTGGLVGSVEGKNGDVLIESCFADVDINGDYYNLGGFAGGGAGTYRTIIRNCYAQGTITRDDGNDATSLGGFAGEGGAGTIEDCYSTGPVIYDGDANPTSKGFLGAGSPTESNNFWDTETSAQATTTGSATGKSTAQMKTTATFSSWDIATHLTWTTEIWYIEASSDYPRLGFEYDTTGPTFSINSKMDASSEAVSSPVTLSFSILDGDSSVSHYIFSWNNSGSWANQTASAWVSNPSTYGSSWSSTIGDVIYMRVYANDTFANWATSSDYNVELLGGGGGGGGGGGSGTSPPGEDPGEGGFFGFIGDFFSWISDGPLGDSWDSAVDFFSSLPPWVIWAILGILAIIFLVGAVSSGDGNSRGDW